MLRKIQSFSQDGEAKLSFQPKAKYKTSYLLKSLIKQRKLRPKSQEPDDSNNQIINQKIGPSRRKSCYCNQCGLISKKQQRFMDLQLIKKPSQLKKSHINYDRRSTLNPQSISKNSNLNQDRSVFYRRNTQKKEERTDSVKSPVYDVVESKNADWYIRQIVKRKSRINVQKLVDNSFSKNSQQQSNKKFNIDELMNVKSQQTIHLPSCINSPSVRIRTIGAFDQINTTTSPKQKDNPKLSPYLSFRQLNMNIFVPIKQKSNRKVQQKILSYTKT